MMNPNLIGNLVYLYLSDIEAGNPTDAPEFLIKATAKLLQESGGRNWLPIIVKMLDKDRYQVIGNSFVYAIAQEANLERVWCIVADDKDETAFLAQVLAREQTPKINLCTADREEIIAGLRFLRALPDSPLKGVQLDLAVNRIEEAKDRKYWQDFTPITKLKCGITKAKVDSLKKVFYLTPEPLPPDGLPGDLRKMKLDQLRQMAKQRGIPVTTKMTKTALLQALQAHPNDA
jgi:hypothetical protein